MKKALTSVLLSLILTLAASGCAPELYERLLISARFRNDGGRRAEHLFR